MRDPKGPVKPYKSPQEIAKQHKVPLAAVMKQVKMGTKVEGEHTTSKSGARITALQHVDELPNYYTKLKKVEKKTMKKEDVSVEQQYQKDTKYCLLCRKNEKRHECGYGPQMWDRYSIAKIHPANMPEEKEYSNIEEKFVKAKNPSSGRKSLPDRQSYKGTETEPFRGSTPRPLRQEIARSSGRSKKPMKEDHVAIAMGKMLDSEGSMIMSQLDQIEMAVAKLRKLVKDPQMQVPAWVQSKITMATDYIDTAADYMSSKDESFEMEEETIDEKRGLWDNIHARRKAGKPPKKPGEEGYPKTLDIDEGLKQARKNVGASKCWPGKVATGTKMKGGREVPDCKEDTCSSFSQFMQIAEVAAWQKKEGKNPSGGLNERGRRSYERENPGSNLQAPQPEGGPRKRSFCARMGGMPGPMKDEKGRPTRKALALRKWKC